MAQPKSNYKFLEYTGKAPHKWGWINPSYSRETLILVPIQQGEGSAYTFSHNQVLPTLTGNRFKMCFCCSRQNQPHLSSIRNYVLIGHMDLLAGKQNGWEHPRRSNTLRGWVYMLAYDYISQVSLPIYIYIYISVIHNQNIELFPGPAYEPATTDGIGMEMKKMCSVTVPSPVFIQSSRRWMLCRTSTQSPVSWKGWGYLHSRYCCVLPTTSPEWMHGLTGFKSCLVVSWVSPCLAVATVWSSFQISVLLSITEVLQFHPIQDDVPSNQSFLLQG